MFGKNKKEERKPVLYTDYSFWEKDLGFLESILSKKKTIASEFIIKTFANQLKNSNDYLKDEDITPVIQNVVMETFDLIGDSYKEFLRSKYFGNDENIVKYLTEDVCADLTIEAINTNHKKILDNFKRERLQAISEMNSGTKQNSENSPK